MAEPENKPEVMIISSSPGRGGAEKSLSPRNLRTDFRQIFIPSEIKIQGIVPEITAMPITEQCGAGKIAALRH